MATHQPIVTPVFIAEQILQLTKANFDISSPQDDSLALYNAKIRMQDLCDQLLQTVLGRLGYTILLAGECTVLSETSATLDLLYRILPGKLGFGFR
jgi:hypothetical protein